MDGWDSMWRNRAPGPHAHGNTARQAMDGLWTEARGQQKQPATSNQQQTSKSTGRSGQQTRRNMRREGETTQHHNGGCSEFFSAARLCRMNCEPVQRWLERGFH